ncbi:MAG: hypothetical protein E6790_08660 [Veillonella sp.]|uniref:hypothetical protein n=1 Tax=Veillonella sp. TaxID=1926307 RepID=UPI002900CE70|nr:hypothetical protein [Veillonella sp.]MDU1827528.1 hypothetical protein [Veillonella sp.]
MMTWPEYKRMLDEERKRKNQEKKHNDDYDFIMPLMAGYTGYMAANALDHNHHDNHNDYNDNSYDNDYSDNNYDCNNDCGSSYDSSNDCMIMDSFLDIF